jgi:hypothetical protein
VRTPVYYSSARNDDAIGRCHWEDNNVGVFGNLWCPVPYNFPRLPLLPISAIVVCPSLHFAPKVILGRILRILICQILVNCAPFIASVVSGSRSANLSGWVGIRGASELLVASALARFQSLLIHWCARVLGSENTHFHAPNMLKTPLTNTFFGALPHMVGTYLVSALLFVNQFCQLTTLPGTPTVARSGSRVCTLV